MESWPTSSAEAPLQIPKILACDIVLAIFLNKVMLLRFYSKLRITRKVQLDDYLVIPGYICAMLYILINLISTNYGWGHHIWDVPQPDRPIMRKLARVWGPAYMFGNGSIKVSILAFYRRIFASDIKYRRLIDISIVITAIFNITFSFLNALLFKATDSLWNVERNAEKPCGDLTGYIVYSSVDSFADLYLLVLFQWKLWQMKLPLSQKMSAALLMGFAALAMTSMVMLIPYLLKACDGTDMTWDGVDLKLWNAGELVLGILCANAPSLRAFFTKDKKNILVGCVHPMNVWPNGDEEVDAPVSIVENVNADLEAGNVSETVGGKSCSENRISSRS